MYKFEGIFRRPRLWSNEELKKIAPLFDGKVINVSAWKDRDKDVSYKEYILGNYDGGSRYKSYFVNASKYGVSNYPSDGYKGEQENPSIDEYDYVYSIDLERETIPDDVHRKFNVVLSHTVLEHVFDVFTAFRNICKMSKDVVIIIVPFTQQVHYLEDGYKDFWRFTPFVLDKLFEENGFKVLYRSSNSQLQSSIYYFYVASRKPEEWIDKFDVKSLSSEIDDLNRAQNIFPLSKLQLMFEHFLRRVSSFIGLRK
jgi:hypothetical protein